MKKRIVFILLVITSTIFSSCTSKYHGQIPNYDDVYYSRSERQPTIENVSTARVQTNQNPDQIVEVETNQKSYSTDIQTDEQGNTFITNNYYSSDFDFDSYYDYMYAARIRRFHSPYTGFDYFHSFHTNYYWYTHNPYNWGVSIYLGYPFWRPFPYAYFSPWQWGFGWWGWNSPWHWGYGWGNPWGFGYNHGYWHGYNHGYWDGYWAGYWAGSGYYYYNSNDQLGNTFFYGQRGNSTGGSNRPAGANNLGSVRESMTFGASLESRGFAENSSTLLKPIETSRTSGNLGSSVSSTTSETTRPTEITKPTDVTRPAETTRPTEIARPTDLTRPAEITRPTEIARPTDLTRPAEITRPTEIARPTEVTRPADISRPTENIRPTESVRPQESSRTINYARPQESSQIRSYTSPEFSRPKSSQEYSAPSNRNNINYNKPNYYDQDRNIRGASPQRPSTTTRPDENRPMNNRPVESSRPTNQGIDREQSSPSQARPSTSPSFNRPSTPSSPNRNQERPSAPSNNTRRIESPSSPSNSPSHARPSSSGGSSRSNISAPSSGGSSRGSISSPSSGSSRSFSSPSSGGSSGGGSRGGSSSGGSSSGSSGGGSRR